MRKKIISQYKVLYMQIQNTICCIIHKICATQNIKKKNN